MAHRTLYASSIIGPSAQLKKSVFALAGRSPAVPPPAKSRGAVAFSHYGQRREYSSFLGTVTAYMKRLFVLIACPHRQRGRFVVISEHLILGYAQTCC
jgi:hypothetical protein